MTRILCLSLLTIALLSPSVGNAQKATLRPGEQLPGKMYTQMSERPRITVGQADADLIGTDNRVLQAAVDYVGGLGGGIVEIRPGQYTMCDSLHLRPNVTVRGTKGKTILRKADGVVSPLAADGDFGEEQITVADPTGFAVGCGVTILEDGVSGFHITTARITGRHGNVFSISKPLMSDCMVASNARAATVFPVVSVYHAENVRIEDLIIEGNKDNNVILNGCRGAGIFLYQGHNATIRGCITRDYNGDGIGFQQSNDVTVVDCITEQNTALGMHPGSGSQRPTVRNCIARHNGTDGLFLCWRVKYGTFEDNLMEQNGQFGISIGHKDSDNLFQRNTVRQNKQHGLFFRNETEPMAPHRNRFVQNVIENNGGAEIRIRGAVRDLVFENNVIRDTQDESDHNIGVEIEEKVGAVRLENNTIETRTATDDHRP